MKAPRENPLGLDMPFDEALARFIGASPAELSPDAYQKKRRPKPPPKVVNEEDPEAPA